MTKDNKHLAKAKDYLTIAESDDSKIAAWKGVADEIIAATEEDATLGNREIGKALGKSKDWVRGLVQWRTSGEDPSHPPFGGEQENAARYKRQVRTVLAPKDPERRRRALAELSTSEVEAIVKDANDVAYDRAVAARQERLAQSEVTPRSAGIEDWNPGESWADKFIMRVSDNARQLSRHVERWGLVFGTLEEDRAFQMLDEAERQIAEIRAAAQERIADARQAV